MDTTGTPPPLARTLTTRLVSVSLFVMLFVFAPAGSLSYWNGWLFLAVLFLPMTIVLFFLLTKHRALLEKRLELREKEKAQKIYVILSLLWCVVTLALPGLDYRFGWSAVPLWLVVVAALIMLGGYILFITAMLQNSFASRIIEIQKGQQLIDTGLYGTVRHPMYMASLVLYLPIPIVLGSFYGLVPLLLLPPLLVYRLLNEEKVLRKGLPGYEEYTGRVRYRLVPGIW